MPRRDALGGVGAVLLWAICGCSSESGAGADGGRDAAPPDIHSVDQAGERTADLSAQDGGSADVIAVDAPPLTLVANEYPCADEGKIYPSTAQNEVGHLIAAKLTPPHTPFTVTTVRYQVEASDTCNNTMAHRVEVTHGPQAAPENTPAEVQTIDVPAVVSAPEKRMIDLALPQPITLAGGEHLFVAVQMPMDHAGKLLCLTICMFHGLEDRNFWSNATGAPYDWTALNGTSMNVVIMALGH